VNGASLQSRQAVHTEEGMTEAFSRDLQGFGQKTPAIAVSSIASLVCRTAAACFICRIARRDAGQMVVADPGAARSYPG